MVLSALASGAEAYAVVIDLDQKRLSLPPHQHTDLAGRGLRLDAVHHRVFYQRLDAQPRDQTVQQRLVLTFAAIAQPVGKPPAL